jgi:simple sugar transport system ATP-binding protein
VLATCNAITVLRQGRVVGSIDREGATEQTLVSMIIGTKAFDSHDYKRKPLAADAPEVVKLQSVQALDDRGREALRGAELTIRAGEIVGVAGVSGNGQKELGEVIQGVRPLTGGTVSIDGKQANGWSIAQRRLGGVACIPEDPLGMGAVRVMTVEENLALGDGSTSRMRGWFPMNWPAARAKASWMTQRFQLKMPRLHVLIDRLSGGNVQRIVCAREMSSKPKVLLAYYPTRGMDINAAEIIRTALLSARDDGAAILVVSEDLDELVGISDRIIVMFHGQNVGETTPDKADLQEIGFLMTDGRRKAA